MVFFFYKFIYKIEQKREYTVINLKNVMKFPKKVNMVFFFCETQERI